MIRRRYRIEGRVQGVGFRWFVARAARELGVAGWVRNLADGAVLCEAQGEPLALSRFEDELRRGPASARVSAVRVDDCEPGAEEAGFDVVR
jgi:acylphosphatase